MPRIGSECHPYLHKFVALDDGLVRRHATEHVHHFRKAATLEYLVGMHLDESDADPKQDLVALIEQAVPNAQNRLVNRYKRKDSLSNMQKCE